MVYVLSISVGTEIVADASVWSFGGSITEART